MATVWTYFSIVLFAYSYVNCDSIDRSLREGVLLKYLRDMVNQTKADTLNLPANATSIRENITDTFSCENRTYGYYADVDNDCQVFHVCLTTQAASGRNATYRWSFICPKETVFNQEVLTCTYPRDSINCEDSPNYYDLNMEIGKVPNDTETNNMNNNVNNQNNYNNQNNNPNYNQQNNYQNNYNQPNSNQNSYNQQTSNQNNYNQPSSNQNNYNQANNNMNYYNNNNPTRTNPNAEIVKVKDQRKQTNRRKQNIIVEKLQKVVEDENLELNLDKISAVDETLLPVIEITEDENFEQPEEEITQKPVTKFENKKITGNKKQNSIKENKKTDIFNPKGKVNHKVDIKNVDMNDGVLLPIIEDVTPLNIAAVTGETNDSRLSMERRKRQERKFRGSVRFKINV